MATSASDAAATFRDRWDNTAKLPAESRRLDTLANLLMIGNSQCVATCIISGQLYVTANELKKVKKRKEKKEETEESQIEDQEEKEESEEEETKKSKRVMAIEEILRYFGGLPASKPLREDIFKKIFSGQRLKALIARSSLFMPTDIEKDWANLLVSGTFEDRTPEHVIAFIKNGGENAGAHGLVYGEGCKLFRGVKKIESLVRGEYTKSTASSSSASSLANLTIEEEIENEEKSEKTKAEILRSALKKEPIILQNETEAKVHAEVQMLSHIIDMIKSEELYPKESLVIYIGISKLCCLQCQCMLTAANQVFKENGINIILETRGYHNRDFSWAPPDLFEKGYNTLLSEPKRPRRSIRTHNNTYLEDIIAYRAKKEVEKEINKLPLPGNLLGHASDSDEQRSEDGGVRERNVLLMQLKNRLSEIEEMGVSYEDLLKIVIGLHKVDAYTELYEVTLENFDEKLAKKTFAVIMEEATGANLKPKISKELLLKILKSPDLVGKEISNLYRKTMPKLPKPGSSAVKPRSVAPSSSSSSSSSSSGAASDKYSSVAVSGHTSAYSTRSFSLSQKGPSPKKTLSSSKSIESGKNVADLLSGQVGSEVDDADVSMSIHEASSPLMPAGTNRKKKSPSSSASLPPSGKPPVAKRAKTSSSGIHSLLDDAPSGGAAATAKPEKISEARRAGAEAGQAASGGLILSNFSFKAPDAHMEQASKDAGNQKKGRARKRKRIKP